MVWIGWGMTWFVVWGGEDQHTRMYYREKLTISLSIPYVLWYDLCVMVCLDRGITFSCFYLVEVWLGCGMTGHFWRRLVGVWLVVVSLERRSMPYLELIAEISNSRHLKLPTQGDLSQNSSYINEFSLFLSYTIFHLYKLFNYTSHVHKSSDLWILCRMF